MPTDLKRLREDAVKKAMADLPEEYDPSSFADAGELHSEKAGEVGYMLDEARKTPEPEEKPKAAEPEGGRYDLQNRMAPSAVRAGMEMFKQYHPDYFKQMREAVGRTYWTDPLAEGEEEWEPVPVEEIDKDTGEDWKDTGEDWTHEDR